MKDIFKQANDEFIRIHETQIPDFWTNGYYEARLRQAQMVIDSINDKFNFKRIIALETGTSQNMRTDYAFGLFIGLITEKVGGKMISVDIDNDRLINSKKLFSDNIPNLDYSTYCDDSINFLKNFDEKPNLVHLDNWDCDMKNPLPSALHAFLEFLAIESKMESGSIIMIDDNFLQGSWIDWIYPDRIERIDITYPILGKGALIYHHVLNGKSGWNLIGNHYNLPGINIKIIIQKD